MKKLYEEPTLEFIKLLFDSELLTGSIIGGEGEIGQGGSGNVGDGDDPLAGIG